MCEAFRHQSFLYTLTAESARIKHCPRWVGDEYPYTIHVRDVHQIIKFSDREEGVPPIFDRNQSVCEFVRLWKKEEGNCNFAALPPNGVLTYVGRGCAAPRSVGVILQNACRERGLVFRSAVTNPVPSNCTLKSISLFIDGTNASNATVAEWVLPLQSFVPQGGSVLPGTIVPFDSGLSTGNWQFVMPLVDDPNFSGNTANYPILGEDGMIVLGQTLNCQGFKAYLVPSPLPLPAPLVVPDTVGATLTISSFSYAGLSWPLELGQQVDVLSYIAINNTGNPGNTIIITQILASLTSESMTRTIPAQSVNINGNVVGAGLLFCNINFTQAAFSIPEFVLTVRSST